MDDLMDRMKESILNPTEQDIERRRRKKEVIDNGGCHIIYFSNVSYDKNMTINMTMTLDLCYGLNEEKVKVFSEFGENIEIDHFQIRSVIDSSGTKEYSKYDDIKCYEKFGIDPNTNIVDTANGQCFNS